MGIPGAIQCRICVPSAGADNSSHVINWSLPAWALGMISASVGYAIGLDPSIVVHKRIAQEMNLSSGQEVEFEFVEIGERFKSPIVVRDNVSADVILHGAVLMGIFESESMCSTHSEFRLKNGKTIRSPLQELWAGAKISESKGSATLTFDGASRNNPDGPAGYGFHIATANGKELVRGYGYYKSGTSNQMEYKGLLDGLEWAYRLDLQKLEIKGDSELVIKQCNNQYQVNDSTLKTCHSKVSELLKNAREFGTEVTLRHIPREENTRADSLANLGIDSMSHATVCNWDNINELCQRSLRY